MSKKDAQLSELEADLAPWLPRSGENGKLLEAAAAGVAELSTEINEVESGLKLREAETLAEIEQIAEPTQINPDFGESLNSYRARTLQNFQSLTTHGKPEDILNVASSILNIEPEEIELQEVDTEPIFNVKIPLGAINSEVGSTEKAKNILLDSTAASYGINILTVGTLLYITESERNNANYDSSDGYATLDSNGDITNGGTYSGVFIQNN
jgi:hypothetical protein